MFLEVLLALPLYIFIFYVFIRYKYIIKAMTSLDYLLSNLDVVDTPKEGVEQQRETIKDVIEHGKDKILTKEKKGNGVVMKWIIKPTKKSKNYIIYTCKGKLKPKVR